MIGLFLEHLDRAETDDGVKAICLTAQGDKAFCSGADLAASLSGPDVAAGAKNYAALLRKMSGFSKPIVAKVNGHCLAGGMGLMLACDMVYARDQVKFGTPEVNVGVFPMMIAALIFRNATRKKASEMIFTARLLSAAEAEDMGLITRTVPAEDLDRIVDETLAAIAAKAPLAIKLGKHALASVEDMDLDQALDFLAVQLARVAVTEDAKEGLTAFLEKRAPVWKGQ
jgi:enoyl-CoA hydratase/carnithine racemase